MENIINGLSNLTNLLFKRKGRVNLVNKKDFLFCNFFPFIEFDMDFQKAQKEKLRFWQVWGMWFILYTYMSFPPPSGERMSSNAHFFHILLVTQLDPTDKSLLTVYVITVEKFVKSQIWQHGFTNILK